MFFGRVVGVKSVTRHNGGRNARTHQDDKMTDEDPDTATNQPHNLGTARPLLSLSLSLSLSPTTNFAVKGMPPKSSKSLKAEPDCEVCGDRASFTCTNCMATHYCSKACQVKHWPVHKDPCRSSPVFLKNQKVKNLKARIAELEGTRDEDDPNTNVLRGTLALLLKEQGKLNDAGAVYRTTLASFEMTLGPHHVETLVCQGNYSMLLYAQGKLADAAALARAALEGWDSVGKMLPSAITCCSNLGMLYQEMGRLNEAEKYMLTALARRESSLGTDHPDTLTSINNLAILFCSQGKVAKADEYFRKALAALEKVRGPNHPQTIQTVINVGSLAREQGKFVEAKALLSRGLEGHERNYGRDHSDTLLAVHSIAQLLDMQGSLAEAEEFYRRAVEGRERMLGKSHPDSIESALQLGILLEKQGKRRESAELLLRFGLL